MRTQFSVYLFSDSSIVLEAEPELAESGYRFSRLSMMQESLERLRREAPDVIVLDASVVEGDASLYVERILKTVPGTAIIAIVETVDNGLSLKGQVYDFLLRSFVRGETLLMMIDKACEKVYYQNRVEQLLNRLKTDGRGDFHEAPNVPAEAPLAVNTKTGELIDQLEKTNDPKEAVKVFQNYFHERVEKQPLLFFKHLPGHHSLGILLTAGVSIEKLRGVGVNLAEETVDQRLAALRSPQTNQKLKALMKRIFACEEFVARPMTVNQEVYGWLVKFGGFATAANEAFFHSMARIVEKIVENKSLRFRLHSLQSHEADTDLLNRSSLYRALNDEIARSRRTHLPVSLILLSIDDFPEYERNAGGEKAVRLRKSVAALLTKTSRITDIATDLTIGEFALLMPHTNQQGAAVKAEKLRRVVESSEFPGADKLKTKKVTLSIGVSEYPGFCGDADGLFKAADDALFYVKGIGGNRVCLAKKPDSFVPDFEARSLNR